MKTIRMTLDSSSIDAAINELQAYASGLQEKANEIARRLSEIGAVNVSLGFARGIYSSTNDVSVTVEERGEGSYAIVASGETVLFIEFGAGVTYGYGHPQAGEFGYGPGTYPGQTHAMTGKGWWFTENGQSRHTYGNPPNMPMYLTAQGLRERVLDVAREVFSA